MNGNIEIRDNGSQATVILNGVDISNDVSKVEYVHQGADIAKVKLTFLADNVSISSSLLVTVSESILDALKMSLDKEACRLKRDGALD